MLERGKHWVVDETEHAKSPLTVCYYGSYNREDPRNRLIRKGLKKHGISVVECNVPLWKGTDEKVRDARGKVGSLLNRLLKYVLVQLRLLIRHNGIAQYDVMVVGTVGQFDMLTAKFAASLRNKKVIFDCFFSLYDTVVNDRQIDASLGIKRLLRVADRLACKVADIVITDTYEHAKYFAWEYDIRQEKFHRVVTGVDEDRFRPLPLIKDGTYKFVYFGTYLPLHGTEYIVRAAKLLERDPRIEFVMIGDGGEFDRIYKISVDLNVRNIRFVGRVSQARLREFIANSYACFGCFGDTDKSRRVVPTKVYEALMMERLVITADTPAIREVFGDDDNLVLTRPADPESLAEKIGDMIRSERVFRRRPEYERFSTSGIGRDMIDIFRRLRVMQ